MLQALAPIASAVGSIGGLIAGIIGRNQDRQDQLTAAKNSVQWRVADANKAGVNPLAALGMNPISLAPTSIGDPGFAEAGQAVERAMHAGSTSSQRADAMSSRLIDAQITGAELDNDIKRAELASMVRRTLQAPGMTAVPGISVDGTTRTVNHPVFGSVTREGMAAGDLQEEIGEVGDWMEGGNYINEWVRTHLGFPIFGGPMAPTIRDWVIDREPAPVSPGRRWSSDR